MRTVFFMIYLGIYMAVSLVFSIKYKYLGAKGKKIEQDAYLDKVSVRWGRDMVKVMGCDVEVIGLDHIPDENVLYVSNHGGNIDIPLCLGYLPKLKGFVAKIELKKAPIISSWMKRLGCLFLDRSSIRQSMEMILQGIEMLKNGQTLLVFPEGTRSKSNVVGEFKKGSLQLAVKSGVPVVPLTIENSYKTFEENKRICPAKIKITVHKPIYMDSLSPEEKKNLAEMVRKVIIGNE
ncbi:MAG: 1-acyl-sn-glycerol-3-phosphate acyltransferase [Firmicutes bacterium HGW-Firmicutes-7]|nr:MAG: 1-acyl-sn-glycerol-3-phosphate acyltransferase [Firmicutes bacterium HGW-Firmicutes-7]